MTAAGTSPLPVRLVLERLRRALGEVEAWPGECDLEYVCGAVLVQNTAWTNVEHALDALREATAFDARRLLALGDDELRVLIRPAGFMRAKSATLRAYVSWSLSPAGRGAEHLDDAALRDALLALRGVGPETADVIALMVFHRRRFIFDAYARRLLRQAGYDIAPHYERARRALEGRVDAEALSLAELVEIHGRILEAGKRARTAGGWEVYGPRIGIAPHGPTRPQASSATT